MVNEVRSDAPRALDNRYNCDARRMTSAHAMRCCAAQIACAPASQARVNHGCKIDGTGIFTRRD
jgi:hypothetical protein